MLRKKVSDWTCDIDKEATKGLRNDVVYSLRMGSFRLVIAPKADQKMKLEIIPNGWIKGLEELLQKIN